MLLLSAVPLTAVYSCRRPSSGGKGGVTPEESRRLQQPVVFVSSGVLDPNAPMLSETQEEAVQAISLGAGYSITAAGSAVAAGGGCVAAGAGGEATAELVGVPLRPPAAVGGEGGGGVKGAAAVGGVDVLMEDADGAAAAGSVMGGRELPLGACSPPAAAVAAAGLFIQELLLEDEVEAVAAPEAAVAAAVPQPVAAAVAEVPADQPALQAAAVAMAKEEEEGAGEILYDRAPVGLGIRGGARPGLVGLGWVSPGLGYGSGLGFGTLRGSEANDGKHESEDGEGPGLRGLGWRDHPGIESVAMEGEEDELGEDEEIVDDGKGGCSRSKQQGQQQQQQLQQRKHRGRGRAHAPNPVEVAALLGRASPGGWNLTAKQIKAAEKKLRKEQHRADRRAAAGGGGGGGARGGVGGDGEGGILEQMERVEIVAPGAAFGGFEEHTSGVGSRLMRQMGWQEGMGLGRERQGRAVPLQAVMRPRNLGLGA